MLLSCRYGTPPLGTASLVTCILRVRISDLPDACFRTELLGGSNRDQWTTEQVRFVLHNQCVGVLGRVLTLYCCCALLVHDRRISAVEPCKPIKRRSAQQVCAASLSALSKIATLTLCVPVGVAEMINDTSRNIQHSSTAGRFRSVPRLSVSAVVSPHYLSLACL